MKKPHKNQRSVTSYTSYRTRCSNIHALWPSLLLKFPSDLLLWTAADQTAITVWNTASTHTELHCWWLQPSKGSLIQVGLISVPSTSVEHMWIVVCFYLWSCEYLCGHALAALWYRHLFPLQSLGFHLHSKVWNQWSAQADVCPQLWTSGQVTICFVSDEITQGNDDFNLCWSLTSFLDPCINTAGYTRSQNKQWHLFVIKLLWPFHNICKICKYMPTKS